MLTLKQRDQAVNWHPYTQMKTAKDSVPIVRGEGAYIFDENNKRYIDAVSSWWVTLHGHAHPYIAKKVNEQLHTLEQVIFAGFTHRPAIELSERLLELLPSNQARVFYSDNGSTAVEVALKMCMQFHYNNQKPRQKILAFKNAYHGDTFGAMSVSERGTWTNPFRERLFEVLFIDVPGPDTIQEIKQQIAEWSEDIVCFIYEPLVQGAAGMLMHEASYLNELMCFCRQQDILLVQDEVFVGFGRTGKLFAADHLSEIPDIMCFSKGLTGGTMPLGVTTCAKTIYEAFYSDDADKALYHGHSFTASPLACTAALASLDLLLEIPVQERIAAIVNQHQQFCERIKNHQNVKAIRQCGTILALEWKIPEETSYFSDMNQKLYPYFLERGILLRPLGNVIYLVPPYCIAPDDLEYIYDTISNALNEL